MRVVILITLMSCSLYCYSQQVEWVKRYSCGSSMNVYTGLKVRTSYYIAGNTGCGAFYINPRSYVPYLLLKLNGDGDSVYQINPGMHYGAIMAMSESPDGFIMATARVDGFGTYYGTHIYTIDTNGILYRTDTIFTPSGKPWIGKSITGRDGSTIVVGQIYQNAVNDFWFLRKPYLEPPGLSVSLSHGHPNSMAHNVEQLPNGHYLMSGTEGSRISSFEVDSLGGNPQYIQWWQDEDLVNLSYGSVTRIGKNRRLVKGNTMDSRHYIGIYEADGSKIWGHVEQGGSLNAFANNDSSFVDYNVIEVQGFPTYQYHYFVKKFNFDSSEVWSAPIHSYFPTGPSYVFGIRDMLYNFDSVESAVVVGVFYKGSRSSASAFKVTGVGIPATSVGSPRIDQSIETLHPYPNPGTRRVDIGVLFSRAEVVLYNMLGEAVLQQTLVNSEPLDISHLPPGLYQLKANADGKQKIGKVLKW